MKSEFYDKNKRSRIYRAIFIYKVVFLLVILTLNTILALYFFSNFATYQANSELLAPYYSIVGLRLLLILASILLDIFILVKTASVERRLSSMAYLDKLTGLPNRYSCDLLIQSFNEPSKLPTVGFILLQINNLNSVNSSGSHKDGNNLIAEFSFILEDISEKYGYVGRNGGNEFMVLLENCDNTMSDMFLMDLTKRIHGYNAMNVGTPIEVSYSKVLNAVEHKESMSDIISLGYRRIHEIPQILS